MCRALKANDGRRYACVCFCRTVRHAREMNAESIKRNAEIRGCRFTVNQDKRVTLQRRGVKRFCIPNCVVSTSFDIFRLRMDTVC